MPFPAWLRGRGRRKRVELTDDGVVHHLGDGQTEWVDWEDLERVEILTTSRDGPDDFYFILDGGGQVCTVPHGLSEGLLERLQQLPGFDLSVFIRATASRTHARFVCWVAPDRPDDRLRFPRLWRRRREQARHRVPDRLRPRRFRRSWRR